MSYPEYFRYKLEDEYIDYLYTARTHQWTFGVFLEKLEHNLDSEWLSSTIGSQDEDLRNMPLDGCSVRSGNIIVEYLAKLLAAMGCD